MKVSGRVVCPTKSGRVRLWRVCARYVPAFLLAPRSRWTLLAPVGTLLGMSASPPFDPERELRRLQCGLASQEPAELRQAYLARLDQGRLRWPGTTVRTADLVTRRLSRAAPSRARHRSQAAPAASRATNGRRYAMAQAPPMGR